jgi:hypothetical protein
VTLESPTGEISRWVVTNPGAVKTDRFGTEQNNTNEEAIAMQPCVIAKLGFFQWLCPNGGMFT